MAQISNITLPDGTNYDLKGSIYTVIGTQTATTAAWTGTLNTIDALYDGLTIAYYLPRTSAANVTLNLTLKNNVTTGAINCYYKTSTRLGTHYAAGDMVLLTYWSAGSININGTATTDNRWIAHGQYVDGNTNYVPAIYISTAAKTAAKVGTLTGASWSGITANMYAVVDNHYDNTASAALTLNVNSHGAKPIYINGTASSTTNHTLPRGMYIIYFNGTYWDFRTDGTLPLTGIPTDRGLSVVNNSIGHINSITAQTTQGFYPIEIDAQGHITAYGSAITPLTSSSSLDASKLTGTVPTSVLPSYVDDVLEYTAKANFPATGEEGKIYVDKTTNLTWRWGGSAYVEISPSLALGSTASTAAKGNHTHTVTATGTIAVQTAGTTTTVPNVTGVGSVPTTEDITADDITAWSAGTLPTLGTAIPADDITAWSAGTNPSLTITNQTVVTGTSVSNEVMSFTTATNGSASGWSAGTAPSLSYTAKSIPNVTGVGTLPSLSYTSRTIKSVKSVGSTPTLGTAITVKTGDAAYKFTGTSATTSVPA